VSHRLLELFYVADIDYSWLAKFLSLLVLPAAHDDLAILLGGYLVVNQLMPVGIVVATIYFGMVASDLALYAIGAGARWVPWLGRLAVNKRVAGFGGILQRNLLGLAALSRVVPGAVFVVMVACGWTRVPWTRVALASLISSALYLPLMLYLVIVFGEALDNRAGLWTWPFLLGLIVALAFMRYRVFTFHERLTQTELERSHPRWRTRPTAAAFNRTRTVLPQVMRSGTVQAWRRTFSSGSNAVGLDVRNPAAGP
jgi:membrane protein DedA with SNARE-associated domain